MTDRPGAFWAVPAKALFDELKASAAGLSGEEARRRLVQ